MQKRTATSLIFAILTLVFFISFVFFVQRGDAIKKNANIYIVEDSEGRQLKVIDAMPPTQEELDNRKASLCIDWNQRISRYEVLAIIFLFSSGCLLMATFISATYGLIRNNPAKFVLLIAVIFFIVSGLLPPWARERGFLRYQFLFAPPYSAHIDVSMLLLEWAIVFVPLGLIYKHFDNKKKNFIKLLAGSV